MKSLRISLLCLIVSTYACSYEPEPCFNATQLGNQINFDDCSLHACVYIWDFGDFTRDTNAVGDSGFHRDTKHIYNAPGFYDVTLYVSNKNGDGFPRKETVEVAYAPNGAYVGSYFLKETCASTQPDRYFVQVAPILNSGTAVQFTNLYHQGATTKAIVLGTNPTRFTIPRQELIRGRDIECNNGFTNDDGNLITLTYTIYVTGSNTVIDQCTAQLQR